MLNLFQCNRLEPSFTKARRISFSKTRFSASRIASSRAYDLHTYIISPSRWDSLDLTCSRPLQEEGQLEALSKALMQSSVLSTLILRENNFGGAMSCLAPAFRALSSSLTHLDLSHCNLRGYRNARNISALSSPLGSLTKLTTLLLAHNDLGLKGAVVVAKATNKMSLLSRLDLSHNDLADEGCIEVLSSLQSAHLTDLDLSGNDFGAEGIEALAELISSGCALRRLVLNGNDLGSSSGASRLAKAIQSNPNLCSSMEELHLSGCNLRDDGLKSLTPALYHLKHLKHLDLTHNSIGGSGLEYLSSNINVSGPLPALTSLSLGFNTRLGEADGLLILTLLSSLPGLNFLDLRSTNLHQSSAIDALCLVSKNNKISGLLLGGNKELLMDGNISRLAQVIKSSQKSLRILDLSSTGLEVDSDAEILESISSLDHLESLDLSCNPTLSGSFISSTFHLHLPPSLTSFNLSDCNLQPHSMLPLAHQLSGTMMQKLTISGNKDLSSSILHLSKWILLTAANELKGRGAIRRKTRGPNIMGSNKSKTLTENSKIDQPQQKMDLASLEGPKSGVDYIDLLASAQEKFVLSHHASKSPSHDGQYS